MLNDEIIKKQCKKYKHKKTKLTRLSRDPQYEKTIFLKKRLRKKRPEINQ